MTVAAQACAQHLHNPPAVACEAYVDPLVVALFERVRVMELRRQPDRALLWLLSDAGAG